ncbi:hypothetical protein GCM10023238_06610 [Streptomyces heliomycini]
MEGPGFSGVRAGGTVRFAVSGAGAGAVAAGAGDRVGAQGGPRRTTATPIQMSRLHAVHEPMSGYGLSP